MSSLGVTVIWSAGKEGSLEAETLTVLWLTPMTGQEGGNSYPGGRRGRNQVASTGGRCEGLRIRRVRNASILCAVAQEQGAEGRVRPGCLTSPPTLAHWRRGVQPPRAGWGGGTPRQQHRRESDNIPPQKGGIKTPRSTSREGGPEGRADAL